MKVQTLAALFALGTALSLPLGACSLFEGRETAGGYLDDSEISTKVRAKLVDNQSFKGMNIGVETMDHVVQLSGFVDSQQQKDQAGLLAGQIDGVKSVKNNIVVRRAS